MDDEWKATRWQRKWWAYELTVVYVGPKKFEWQVRHGTYDESLIRLGTQPRFPDALKCAEQEALYDAQARGSVPMEDRP